MGSDCLMNTGSVGSGGADEKALGGLGWVLISRLKSRCQKEDGMRHSPGICFQTHSICWQNAIIVIIGQSL